MWLHVPGFLRFFWCSIKNTIFKLFNFVKKFSFKSIKNSSKKSFLNWWSCSVISSFSVSISWKFSFGSDIHSRFLNVLTMTYSFLVKEFNVSVKTSEDISNSTDSSTMLHTSIKSTMSFLLLFSVCIDEIMRSVNSFSVIVTIDSKSKFASPIF